MTTPKPKKKKNRRASVCRDIRFEKHQFGGASVRGTSVHGLGFNFRFGFGPTAFPPDQENSRYHEDRAHDLLRENAFAEKEMSLHDGRDGSDARYDRGIVGADAFHARGQKERRDHRRDE